MKKLALALLAAVALSPHPSLADPPTAPAPDGLEAAWREAARDPRARSIQRGEPTLPTIMIERYRLPNGLDVVLSPGGSASLVDVRVAYAVGTQDAPLGRAELAHVVEHLSFTRPTRRVPEGLLAAGEALGAPTPWGETTLHEMRFGVEAPTESLERILWGEATRMDGPLAEVDAGDLAREWQVLALEADVYRRWPSAAPMQVLSAQALAAGRSPFAIDRLGEYGGVTEVRSFARRWLVPANARLTIVGNFSPARARAWIARYFGPLRNASVPARAPAPATTPLVGTDVIWAPVARSAGYAQVAVAWPTPPLDEPGGVEMDLLARCLKVADVGEPLSRANLAARVELADIRSVNRHLLLYAPTPNASALSLRADVVPGRTTAEVLAALDASLARRRDELAHTGCDEGVVRDYAWGLVDAADDLPERAGRVAQWPDPADPGAFRRHLARVRAFRGDEVQAVMQRWFAPDRRLVAHLAIGAALMGQAP